MASSLIRRTITTNIKKLPCLSSPSCNNNWVSHHSSIHKAMAAVSFHSEPAAGGGAGLPSYMRGAVFWEPNKPLTIEEFHMPRPKAGEVLIKTKGTLLLLLQFLCSNNDLLMLIFYPIIHCTFVLIKSI